MDFEYVIRCRNSQCNDAVAFEAAAALDAYGMQLASVRRDGMHAHRLASLQAALARVCSCCLGLPSLSAPAIALLLAHHRVLAELGQSEAAMHAPASQPGLHAIEQCVAHLQLLCRKLFLAAHLQ